MVKNIMLSKRHNMVKLLTIWQKHKDYQQYGKIMKIINTMAKKHENY